MNILETNPGRFSLFPLSSRHRVFYDAFKQHQSTYWTTEEIDFSQDQRDYDTCLSADEQAWIKKVLSFFAVGDGIVNENINMNFFEEIQVPEARCFYAMQELIETIHMECYGTMIEAIVSTEEQRKIANAIHTDPFIARKAEWATQWFYRDRPFQERLVAFMVVEGIHFSASFASIFYLRKSKPGKLPGITFANELISRDEALHCSFAILLLQHGGLPMPEQSVVHDIVRSGVDVEKDFVRHCLMVPLIGMSETEMCAYVEYTADYWLQRLGFDKIYKTKNPFEFMEHISLSSKSNFFEKRVAEYSMAQVNKSDTLTFDDDF